MWKDIEGYEGLYAVNEKGEVWSYYKQGLKAQRLNQSGYLIVQLYKNNKSTFYTVHRLVANAFLPNPNNFPVINHKDENKMNNNVENLEWCSVEYNVRYTCNKLVRCIETGQIFNSLKEAAASVNRKSSTMCSHLKGYTQHCGGYHWQYVDKRGED